MNVLVIFIALLVVLWGRFVKYKKLSPWASVVGGVVISIALIFLIAISPEGDISNWTETERWFYFLIFPLIMGFFSYLGAIEDR
ncbi:MAG: hypothetical protein GYB33_09880 [Gammaproteobacteria bacterium]|nr:hypothetical protein [Gammaproteobacteria bacterium]